MGRHLEWVKDAVKFRSLTHPLRSSHWPKVRADWLKNHPWCAACGFTDSVQVHHKVPFHIDRLKELDPSNFITLCESEERGNHHLHIGHDGDWKDFNPNVEADARMNLLRNPS